MQEKKYEILPKHGETTPDGLVWDKAMAVKMSEVYDYQDIPRIRIPILDALIGKHSEAALEGYDYYCKISDTGRTIIMLFAKEKL